MRVVSFVPSWTETLISAQVEVVGRTRFCIHPEGEIKSIPVVGGTKNINLERFKESIKEFISGKDILSDKIIDLKKELTIEGKTSMILELK